MVGEEEKKKKKKGRRTGRTRCGEMEMMEEEKKGVASGGEMRGDEWMSRRRRESFSPA